MAAQKVDCQFTVRYVPCPPEHAARWWAGMRLIADMVLDSLYAEAEPGAQEAALQPQPSPEPA